MHEEDHIRVKKLCSFQVFKLGYKRGEAASSTDRHEDFSDGILCKRIKNSGKLSLEKSSSANENVTTPLIPMH